MRIRVIILRSKYCDIHKEKTGCKDSQAPILQLTKVYKVGGGRNFDSFQGKIVFFKKKKPHKKSHLKPANLWLLGVPLSHQNTHFPTRIFAIQLCIFPLKK